MGFDASVISGIVRFIEPEFNLTKIQLGWAVSSLTLTATLAMLIAGPLSDKMGRRKVLSIAAILYTLSAIFSAIAPSFVFLVIARMLGGFGVGASLIIAPMYIAEISPAKIRGRLVSINQLNIVIGISAAFFSNYLILHLSQSQADWTKSLHLDEYVWRWMLGIESVPAIAYFLALFFVPRSPRWLIMKNRDQEAVLILKKTAGDKFSEEEIQDIKDSLGSDRNSKKINIREIFRPVFKNVLIIGIVIAVTQQLTGINSVFFYAPMIFEQSGLGTNASFSQAILVGLTNLIFTVLAMLFIDRTGRKPLLIFGVSGVVISMFVLAFGFHTATYKISDSALKSLPREFDQSQLLNIQETEFTNDTEFREALNTILGPEMTKQYESELFSGAIRINTTLILIAILAFVASFAISIGPVMWVLFSELFPNSIRAVAISFVGFINSIISFIVQLVFPWELENLGSASTFFLYGLFSLAGLLFILLKVPETKGKSLEELQKLLIR